MTLDEIEQSVKGEIGGHELVHTRFGPIDCEASLLLEAFEQIKRAVVAVSCGIEDPKDRRAKAYLLMLLDGGAWHHGYTPKAKEEASQ
jgi:hypothetical protein